MTPIRVGLIGLSTARDLEPGSWAVSSHLPSILNSPHYTLVALANSTVESARKSIAAHGLPSTTKAYGSPEDLANDPDIDLVVVSVRVKRHFELTRPAILNKKDVFVEWPLGVTADEAQQLTDLAEANGVKTVVGLQTRTSKLTLKLQEVLKAGKIGKVVSSTAVEYYLDMKSGGNEFFIFFGHFLDTFVEVLGGFTELQSLLKTQFPTIPLLAADGKVIDPAHPKTAPDHILLQGVLESNAVASIAFRKPQSPVDDLGFRWLITGTEGEIEVTAPQTHWQMTHNDVRLRIKLGSAAEVEEVDLRSEGPAGVPEIGANIALLYDAFARGDTAHYATFKQATKHHQLLEEIVRMSHFGA
ncbi:oxidoreductase [Ilyonectria sp. MPI-CAGE-AT-0026]|nr:oxidoreductase [Ilyonectria sp. MPI-CAGE-AT-0026]